MTDPNDWVAALQRIAELEAAVQHADELVAVLTYVEQRLCIEGDYCTDRHCVVEAVERIHAAVTSVAKERDAALERAEKAERDANWALEHANISLPPRQR